ncbi:Imidazole glycerol phosphate synthase amidotransferase subunit [Prochlorococcus sp. MIT 0603]|nr:Imidazole glycerol phosphate synthase amidotransferase subunit [Prochlorococcus sp. MIT 0603]
MGNLHSVEQSFKRLHQPLKIVKEEKDIDECHALILPGVGAFDPAMRNLKQTNLIPKLKEWNKSNKPLLGICLGLQLLFESSDEGTLEGLGLIKGKIKHLPEQQNQLIPHMGWSLLNHHKQCPLFDKKDGPQWMYFVHSFAAVPDEDIDIAASVNFGEEKITAIIWKDKLSACQFHPEKSGKSGQKLLTRWLNWAKEERLKSN